MRCEALRILHERLKIMEEVEKNPTEKQINVAQWLRSALSTINFIVVKKREIQEQTDNCGKLCKKRKKGLES
jgi:hypothetical protein